MSQRPGGFISTAMILDCKGERERGGREGGNDGGSDGHDDGGDGGRVGGGGGSS